MKFNMSYSALNTYLESERTFYYSKIKKIKPVDKVIECYGNAGNVVHNVLEEFIKGNDNYDIVFEWDKIGLNEQYDFRGHTLNLVDYDSYATYGINFIKELTSDANISSKLTPELYFEFPYENNGNVTIKGYIDLVFKKENNDIILFDWKTDSQGNHKKHEKQRLFYTWAYHKQFGVLPIGSNWVYLRLEKIEYDMFTIEDIKLFEKELYGIIDDIISKGEDINNYSIGDIRSPFNGYKSLMDNKEVKDKMKVEIVKDERSEEHKVLEQIRSDKYSHGAMIGAYINHWSTNQKKLPTFEEFVTKNVECRMKLKKMTL